MNQLFDAATTCLTGINTEVTVAILSLISIGFIVLGTKMLHSILTEAQSSNSTETKETSIFSNSSKTEDI